MTNPELAPDPPELRDERAVERRAMNVAPIKERREGERRRPRRSDELGELTFAVAMRVTGSRTASSEVTRQLLHALWRRAEGSEAPEVALAGQQHPRVTAFTILTPMKIAADAAPEFESSRLQVELAGLEPMSEPANLGAIVNPGHPTVTVVIPTLNEAKNLPHVLERLPSWIEEVIIVDGHSTDHTVAVAKALRPDVKIVYQSGKGKGNALACGIGASTGEITVMLDADGSTDPAEIPRFVAALTNGYDFAKGTRFVTGGGSDDITRVRRMGNWGITTMVNRIWGSKYSDLAYGYNAFWTHMLPPSFYDCDGFEVETLMGIRLAASDMKVVEVPSFEADRKHGTSNLNARRDGTRVLRTILSEWLRPR